MKSSEGYIEQRTEEWFAARLGKVTASRIADVMARTKSGYGAGRKNYMAELLCERLTGEREEKFMSKPMERGIEMEAFAISAYEAKLDLMVMPAGFVDHRSMSAGASPDGLVGEDGLVEVKCPNTATHINTLLTEVIEKKYILQTHFQMACTGRKWCDFVSFDDRLKTAQLFVKRIERNENMIDDIEREVTDFLSDLELMQRRIEEL